MASLRGKMTLVAGATGVLGMHLLFDLEDHLDLDRVVARQARHADR